MKIVFLCGSLEPGRDGVGDYVRLLASEVLRQGHQTAIVALNDQHIKQEVSTTPQADHGEPRELRLPAEWPAKVRFQRARQWVDTFNPTWVSLQFVPYAFHAKGLPVLLSEQLADLIKDRQLHLMMHESWAGAEPGTGVKRRLMVLLQQAVIKRLIKRLRPTVIHTHLPVYHRRLQRLGWGALPLPLFSNIPVLQLPADGPNSAVFRVGLFSQADASAPIIDFLARLAEHAAQRSQSFQVLLLGGSSVKMQALQATLEGGADLRNKVHYTGFLEPAQLSAALLTCTLGLTSVPRHSLGKSGSVSAFLSHGIPVAAPCVHSESVASDIGFFDADLQSSILLHPDASHLQTAKSAVQRARHIIQVSPIAQLFLADLTGQARCVPQI